MEPVDPDAEDGADDGADAADDDDNPADEPDRADGHHSELRRCAKICSPGGAATNGITAAKGSTSLTSERGLLRTFLLREESWPSPLRSSSAAYATLRRVLHVPLAEPPSIHGEHERGGPDSTPDQIRGGSSGGGVGTSP